MEVKDRIKTILDYYHLSVNEFADRAKIKTNQAVYDLLSGKTKSISQSMENKILSYFRDINRTWLLTGEGDMLVSGNQVVSGSNNTTSQNSGNTTNNTSNNFGDGCGGAIYASRGDVSIDGALMRAFDEIAAQRRVTEKTQAQMDELIRIIKSFADDSASK